jgi:hypothetical protein
MEVLHLNGAWGSTEGYKALHLGRPADRSTQLPHQNLGMRRGTGITRSTVPIENA